ncbi:hypothetical protein PoB_006508700 [Plakobranchus ocellatus]|uniref:Uncharacterized protein n=1 Tax=Plakobranchus ocellatus TaxID=259542 RepID=A0AAV4D330_9GAST|nr:hypothetical protein PoB_006508700 [Plakobranchus ocellatus]
MHRVATKVRKKRLGQTGSKMDEQQLHNGRGRHKIGGNGRHLKRSTSCSGWKKPPSSQSQWIAVPPEVCRDSSVRVQAPPSSLGLILGLKV